MQKTISDASLVLEVEAEDALDRFADKAGCEIGDSFHQDLKKYCTFAFVMAVSEMAVSELRNKSGLDEILR